MGSPMIPSQMYDPDQKSASPSKHFEFLPVVYMYEVHMIRVCIYHFQCFPYYRNISNALPSAKLRDMSNNFVRSICFKFQLETIGNGTIRTYDMYTNTCVQRARTQECFDGKAPFWSACVWEGNATRARLVCSPPGSKNPTLVYNCLKQNKSNRRTYSCKKNSFRGAARAENMKW